MGQEHLYLKHVHSCFNWHELSQEEIVSGWDMRNPVVSISCLTYNHVDYIEQCIQGFLMQKTTFPFEIIIHDDASLDGTDDIIRRYELKYPRIVKPIYEIQNQEAHKNTDVQLKMYMQMAGKYIAFCEGDDFWTDERKLQKQFDFLENNEAYFAVGHLTEVISSGKNNWNDFVDVKPGEYDIGDLERWQLFSHFSAYFSRNICKYISIPDLHNFLQVNCPGDRKYPVLFLRFGKLYVLPFYGSVYRFRSGKTSFTQSKDYGNRLTLWDEICEVSRYAESSKLYFDDRKRKRDVIAQLLYEYFTGKNTVNYDRVKEERNSTILKDLWFCKMGFFEVGYKIIKRAVSKTRKKKVCRSLYSRFMNSKKA